MVEEKILYNIGLLSIKPKIIVCNVDEENLSKGNKYTEMVKIKYPNEKIIHICADIEDQLSGLEKNFIRAEAVSCEDFIEYGSAEKCKENGKLRIEGKDYIVKDGDVLHFRVNP